MEQGTEASGAPACRKARRDFRVVGQFEDAKSRAQILHLLCEGSSIRAVTRLTGASKNTVTKLMIDAGKACAWYHDENVRNLNARRVQVDEIWSFTYAKQKNVATAKAAPDCWRYVDVDRDRCRLQADCFVAGRWP